MCELQNTACLITFFKGALSCLCNWQHSTNNYPLYLVQTLTQQGDIVSIQHVSVQPSIGCFQPSFKVNQMQSQFETQETNYLDLPNQFPITATTVGQPVDCSSPLSIHTATYRYLLQKCPHSSIDPNKNTQLKKYNEQDQNTHFSTTCNKILHGWEWKIGLSNPRNCRGWEKTLMLNRIKGCMFC